MKLNIILACNIFHSHTKNAALLANELTKLGHNVTISYPAFDFFQVTKHRLRKERARGNLIRFAILYFSFFFKISVTFLFHKRRPFVYHAMKSKGIKYRIYPLKAGNQLLKSYDFSIVFQDYLLDCFDVSQVSSPCQLVGSIHTDYDSFEQWLPAGSYEFEMLAIAKKHKTIPRFAVSEAARRSAIRYGIRCDVVIPNGVDSLNYNQQPTRNQTKNIRVLFYCSERPEKGLSTIIRTLALLRSSVNQSSVRLVSIGQISRRTQSLFDENLGFLSGTEYVSALVNADIFVYASMLDGFPAPPLEACLHNVALITTMVGGVEEWARDNVNCLTTDVDDHLALADAVTRLIADPTLRDKLRHQGHETALNYSWKQAAVKLERYLGQLAQATRES